jgi:two-component system response regulator NreC
MTAIRVAVVDDHTLMRQGTVGLLGSQADIEIAGEADSGRAALELVAEAEPDVVLMDIAMPGMSGLDATREIRQRFPDVNVVIVTMHERDDYFFEALRAGASGYVLKGADIEGLLSAVRAAYRGEVYLQPSASKALVADYLARAAKGEDRDRYDGLTDREREVLRLTAQGLTTREIAEELVLSPHTVQSHRERIMSKLDLHTKAALVRYAVNRGLLGD